MINDQTDEEGLYSLSYVNRIGQNRAVYFGENRWILTPVTNALLRTNCLRLLSRFPGAPSLTKVQNKTWQTNLNCNQLLKTSRDTIRGTLISTKSN